MSNETTRVGIVGVGGWAKYGHIPALRSLDGFEVAAVSARRRESAAKVAAEFDIPQVFDDPQALIEDPGIDMVVILTPAPQHAALAKAAIAAGKDVYTEWPLTTTTGESEELLALAEVAGVRHLVGLQRRLGPSARYAKDLIAQGWVGTVRSASLFVSTDAFAPTRSSAHESSLHIENFSHILSIYFGHPADTLFQLVGPPAAVTGIAQNQFPFIEVQDTGEQVPNRNPDQVVAAGTLERGGLFSAHIEGGQTRQTGVQIDIGGTDGVLRLSNVLAFQNPNDNIVRGMTGDATELTELPVPAEYRDVADTSLDQSARDLAHLYSAYSRDKQTGSSEAPTFADAVAMHRIIDRITQTSDAVASGAPDP